MRGLRIIELAKNIAVRFDYKSLEELEKMLLLIFNARYMEDDHELKNVPQTAKELLKSCNYPLSNK